MTTPPQTDEVAEALDADYLVKWMDAQIASAKTCADLVADKYREAGYPNPFEGNLAMLKAVRARLTPPAPIADSERVDGSVDLGIRFDSLDAVNAISKREQTALQEAGQKYRTRAQKAAASAPVTGEPPQFEARSDDDPDMVLRIMEDSQGDVWLSMIGEKGWQSFRACTSQGGGKNLELRKALSAFLRGRSSPALAQRSELLDVAKLAEGLKRHVPDESMLGKSFDESLTNSVEIREATLFNAGIDTLAAAIGKGE